MTWYSKEKLLNIKWVFSTTLLLLSETFRILRRIEILPKMEITRYSCQILMKLEFSRQIFEKYSNIELHVYTSSGSWVVPCRWMERHDKAKAALCNFANAPKNQTWGHCKIRVRGGRQLLIHSTMKNAGLFINITTTS